MPAAFGSLLKTDVDWDYATAPEDGCNGRMMFLPRGKVLGGSSSINAMVYIRGAHADYDGWRDQGNPGWGYDDLLPYFKRSEDNERGAVRVSRRRRAAVGVRGPLAQPDRRRRGSRPHARRASSPTRTSTAPAQDGAGTYQVTQRDGRRCSTAVAFLQPAEERPNLTVETRWQVHRVLFDGTRAVGVAGERDGETARGAGRSAR